MTRKTHHKTAARDLAKREGITYQQALTRLLNAATPTGHVPAFRLSPENDIHRMTNGTLENTADWNGWTLRQFTLLGHGVSYWNPATASLEADGGQEDMWYPLTVDEAVYVTDSVMAGDLMLTYSGFTVTAEGKQVKVLLPTVELPFDDADWRAEGYEFPSYEDVLAYARALEAALTAFLAPFGGYVTVEEDDYVGGPCHTLEAVVPLPAVMEAYAVAEDWFAALTAVVEPVEHPSVLVPDEADVQARREAEAAAAFEALQRENEARLIIGGLTVEVREALENMIRDEWFHIKRIRREEPDEFGGAEATFASLEDSWSQMPVDIQFAVLSTGLTPVSDATLAEVSAVITRLAAEAGDTLLDEFMP